MQTNADNSKMYVVLEREHVAIKKEIQKHPHQRREHHEGVRRRREGDPEAPARAKQRPLPLSTSDETRLLRLTLSRPAAEEQSFFLESAPRAQKTTRRAHNGAQNKASSWSLSLRGRLAAVICLRRSPRDRQI